ncbi:MAG: DM13 domain-containing protein [Phycisphaerales bacterium]
MFTIQEEWRPTHMGTARTEEYTDIKHTSLRRAAMYNTLGTVIVTATTFLAPVTLANATAYTGTTFQTTSQIQDAAVMTNANAVINSGSLWEKDKYDVVGEFRFEQRDDGIYLVVGSDFKTKKGPDLKFVLSPLESSKVKAKTALKGSLIVGELKAFSGAQEFKLPEGTTPSDYQSLLVHCEEKTVLWASAPLGEGELVAHGDDWAKKSNKISGQWEIAKTDQGYVIRLGDDFKTKKAPDLIVLLSPKNIKQLNGKNATAGGLEVAQLKSVKGGSEYLIAGLDSLDGYKSLVIHCDEYSKLWGGADLN